jgi:hypothetical protein
VIYIRSKAEALDAVAAVLALPERRQQIVQLTVRVAMCLDPEARRFLADCQAGLRRRGKPEHAPLEAKLIAKIEEKKPWWPEWADSIKQACVHYAHALAREPVPAPPPGEKPGEIHTGANDPETLFYLIAMSEERAREILRRMAGTSQDLKEYLSALRTRLNLTLLAQQEEAAR